jgi:hypothetical protein
MLLLFFLANAIFYINYRVVDKASMYLPVYLIWALWLGIGYQAILDQVQQAGGKPQGPWAMRLIMAGAVMLALTLNSSRVDLSNDWSTREQSETILANVQPNAIIFGWWDLIPALQYLQLVEGQRGDVTLINRFLISNADMNQLIFNELGQRPIYFNNPSIDLLRQTHVTAVGPLYLITPRDTGCDPAFQTSSHQQPLPCAVKGGNDAVLK